MNDVVVCPSCGTRNAPGDTICRSCGAGFENAPQASAESRRIVTILFSDVSGSTLMGEQLDPESLRRVMARYFALMRAVLERHGATVEKYIGDAVMAVFGMPRAHEDDALRAIRAASEMREALDTLNDELEREWGVTILTRTGLNTGEVLAAEPAADQSLVVGDAVNVAARLEQVAEPGDILIGDSTFRLVRDAVVVEPVGSLMVKGKTQPVAAWKVIEVLPSVTGWSRRLDSPIVSRTAELAALREAYDRMAATASARIVTVMGGAGIGKSRLTAEFLGGLAGEARVALGHCLPYGEGITFRPVIDIIRQLAGAVDADPPQSVRSKVEVLVKAAADAPMVSERVVALLGIEQSSLGVQEAFWAVRRVLQEVAAARPLVVVFDDIQWAEPTLLDLLEYLADWLGDARVLLVCLARSELADVRPGWLADRGHATLMRLDPLPDEAVDELITNLLDGGVLAPGARERIAAVAEGNPLFIEETMRMLVDDELLRLVDGRWTVADDVADTAIPPTIHALITARLDRLDPEERSVLERASVAGREFWWGAVSELTPADLRPVVGRALQALSRKELIRPGYSDLSGEDAFEFTHILIRDAAYAAMPKEVRADLHERLASWMERRAGTWAEDHAEVIGYHYEQVYVAEHELGRTDERTERAGRRAAELLASAGRRAFTSGDMPAAVRLLSRAAPLLAAEEPQRLDVLPRLAFALMETGDFERLMAVVGEAAETAATTGDPRMLAHATILELYIRLFTNPESWAEEAEREALGALETFEEAGDDHGLAKGWSLLGLVHVMKGQFGPAQVAWEQAARHAGSAGERRDELDALAWVLLAMWAGPAPVEDGLRRSLEVLERAGSNHKGRASAMFMRGILIAAHGDVEEARRLVDQARGLLQEVALTVWMAGPLTQMAGLVELAAGDYERAEQALRWGYETLEELGEMAWRPTLAALLAEAVCAQGRSEDAEALAATSEELAGSEDMWSQVLWRKVSAVVHARRGAHVEAEERMRAGLALAESTDSLPLQGEALLGLAEVLEIAGRSEEATTAARDAVARFEHKGDVQAVRRSTERLVKLTS